MGIGKVYRLVNLISLDVAIGAGICAAFLSRTLGLAPNFYDLVVLVAVVWVIYTLDHLLDAKRTLHRAATERHRFHQRHFVSISYVLAFVILVTGFLAFKLQLQVFVMGCALAGFVLLYLIFQQYLLALKEIVGALFYCCGVLLPTWSIAAEIVLRNPLLVGQFFTVVLSNLLIFSWFDVETDRCDGQVSLSEQFGKRVSGVLIVISLSVCIFLGFFILFTEPSWSPLIILVMATVLIVVFLYSDFFRFEDRFRRVGDGIFLFPLLFLLVDSL